MLGPGSGRGPSVQFFSFASGKTTTVIDIGIQPYPSFAVSPDGQWLLYTQADQSAADLMLVENFR